MLEVYNEEIRDLLGKGPPAGGICSYLSFCRSPCISRACELWRRQASTDIGTPLWHPTAKTAGDRLKWHSSGSHGRQLLQGRDIAYSGPWPRASCSACATMGTRSC